MSEVLSVSESVAAAMTIGAYYDELLRPESAWVRRRVETIQFLDENRTEHRVTLDIDTAEVRRVAARHGVPTDTPIPVPLENLKKEFQLDLDIRSADGRPLPATLSDEDSLRAHARVMATIHRNRIAINSMPAKVNQQLFDIVKEPSLDLFLEIANRTGDPLYAPDPDIDLSFNGVEVRYWQRLLFVDEVFKRLFEASQNYLLSTLISADGDIQILKFRYVEVGDTATGAFKRARLGFGAPRIFLPVSGIGTAQREHTRVLAPEGSVLAKVRLSKDDNELPDRAYGRRDDAERAVIYTKKASPGFYGVVVSLIPLLGSFFIPALICSSFLAVLFFFAMFLEFRDSRFSSPDVNADAAVAILSLIPTLVMVYLIRQNEHKIVSKLLFLPRLLVLVSSALAIFTGGAVTADAGHAFLSWLLFTGFAFNVLVSLYLGLASIITYRRSQSEHYSGFPTYKK